MKEDVTLRALKLIEANPNISYASGFAHLFWTDSPVWQSTSHKRRSGLYQRAGSFLSGLAARGLIHNTPPYRITAKGREYIQPKSDKLSEVEGSGG